MLNVTVYHCVKHAVTWLLQRCLGDITADDHQCGMLNIHRWRRRDETVELRRVGGVYMNLQLAHDDCRRIRRCESRRPWPCSLQFCSQCYRGHPFHFMFGSTVGFSGSADRMALFSVWPNSIGMWEKTMREE